MPITVGGTSITFNDSTVQSTAFTGGGGANIQIFSSSGTWTKPSGAKFVMVELWGAGGGGGRTFFGYTNGGEGGGGGAYTTKMFAAPEVGATETVTVGAGGAGYRCGPGSGTGGDGGTTNFGTLLYAGGGTGGSRLTGPCTYTPTSRGGYAFGPAVPTAPPTYSFATPQSSSPTAFLTGMFGGYPSPSSVSNLNNTRYSGVWAGGSGGHVINTPGVPSSGTGGVSIFGGGGGAGGASFRTCNTGMRGGAGRLFGTNTSNLCTSQQAGGGPTSPVDGTNFVGGASVTGQGNPWPGVKLNGGNGGIAAGGAGQTMFFPNPGSSPNALGSGSGGNGYAVVYTW